MGGRGHPAGGGWGWGFGGAFVGDVVSQSYTEKVLTYSPDAYWTFGESSGTDIISQVNANQNGTYSGVTLGQTGIGDGGTAPFFDGANDYADVYSAALSTILGTPSIFSLSMWVKVSGASVWTDGTIRYAMYIRFQDGGNWILAYKTDQNNELTIGVRGNNTVDWVQHTYSSTAWFHLGLTKTEAGDAMKAYVAGSQVETTQTGLGALQGTWGSSYPGIGAFNKTPANVWDGYIAHPAFWVSLLSDADMADLATV